MPLTLSGGHSPARARTRRRPVRTGTAAATAAEWVPNTTLECQPCASVSRPPLHHRAMSRCRAAAAISAMALRQLLRQARSAPRPIDRDRRAKCPLGGVGRRLVAAEPVIKHCGRVPGQGRTPFLRRWWSRPRRRWRPGVDTSAAWPPGGEHPVRYRRKACCGLLPRSNPRLRPEPGARRPVLNGGSRRCHSGTPQGSYQGISPVR